MMRAGRPETDAFRQSMQGVPAKGVLLKEADHQEHESPEQTPDHNDLCSMQAQVSEIKDAEQSHDDQQDHQRKKSPEMRSR